MELLSFAAFLIIFFLCLSVICNQTAKISSPTSLHKKMRDKVMCKTQKKQKPTEESISMEFEEKLLSDPEFKTKWFEEQQKSGEQYFYEQINKLKDNPHEGDDPAR